MIKDLRKNVGGLKIEEFRTPDTAEKFREQISSIDKILYRTYVVERRSSWIRLFASGISAFTGTVVLMVGLESMSPASFSNRSLYMAALFAAPCLWAMYFTCKSIWDQFRSLRHDEHEIERFVKMMSEDINTAEFTLHAKTRGRNKKFDSAGGKEEGL